MQCSKFEIEQNKPKYTVYTVQLCIILRNLLSPVYGTENSLIKTSMSNSKQKRTKMRNWITINTKVGLLTFIPHSSVVLYTILIQKFELLSVVLCDSKTRKNQENFLDKIIKCTNSFY